MRTAILGVTIISAFALPAHALQVIVPRVQEPVRPRVEQETVRLHHIVPQLELALSAAHQALPHMELQAARIEHLMPRIEHGVAALELHLQHALASVELHLPQMEHALASVELNRPQATFGAEREPLAVPPEAWDQQDPADSLYRAARDAMSRGNASQAATLYRRIRTDSRYARSTYRDDAYYWEAYARHSVGTTAQLRQAEGLLRDLRRLYPSFEPMSEVTSLQSRITAALARNGDAQAAQRTNATVDRVTRQQCPDMEEQEMALVAMMSMPAETALPVLRRVMARRDACSADMREHAVMVIARMNSPESEAILLEAAKSDPNPDVRQHAVFWLASQNSPRAIELIEEIVRTSTDSEMIEMAIMSLSRQQSPRAKQLLRDLAGRTSLSTNVRAAALMFLGMGDDPESAAFLRNIWPSLTDEELKEAALMGLGRRRAAGNEEFLLGIVNNANEPDDIRAMALHWLTQQNNLNPAQLGQLYDRATSQDVKQMVLLALSRSNDSTALDQLIRIHRAERDPELRKAIVHWIGQKAKSDPRAVRYLTEIIGG